MAKLLFIQNGNEEANGLMSISANVNQRHESDLMIHEEESLKGKLNLYKPDVVGIPVLTKNHYWALDVAKRVKKVNPSIVVLLGGPHPTFYTRILDDENVDAICRHYGESATLNLLDRLDEGRRFTDIASLLVKENGRIYKNEVDLQSDMAQLPLMNRKLYEGIPGRSKSSQLRAMTSSGCPFSCNFCIGYGVKKEFGKPQFRQKSPKRVIAEINDARRSKEIKTIQFQDDVFGINKKWLDEFSNLYKEKVGLPFYCLLRCDSVNDELVEKLTDMGCFEVGIGIESGNEHIRNKILDKKLPTETIIKAAETLKRGGLTFHTFNMFGLPEENLASAYETLNLNIKIKPDVMYTQMFHPYPGTKFFDSEAEKAIINTNFNKFGESRAYNRDHKKILRLQKLSMLTARNPFIMRPLLPILIRLPLDTLYDKISKASWENIYHKQITAKGKRTKNT